MSNRPNYSKHQRTKQRTSAAKPGAAPKAKPWWQSPLVWVGGLVIVAAAIAIGVTAGGSDDNASAPGTSAETAFAEIIGAPLPPLSTPDAAVGTEAPVIAGQDFSGERLRLGDDGVARVVGFFAHWCPHCQAELPRTVDWLETNQLPDGVEVVAVSTAVDQTAANYPPSAWFEREGWTEAVVVDSEDRALANGFGLTGFPYWVAVDQDGLVVARTSGELSIEQFESLVGVVSPTGSESTAGLPAVAGEVTMGVEGIRLVSAIEAGQIHQAPPDDLIVLDVRTPEEYDEGHLDGARLFDFYAPDFADEIAELPRDQPYLLYCRSGNRSGQTAELMADLGFSSVADVDGGILAWEAAGLPLVP